MRFLVIGSAVINHYEHIRSADLDFPGIRHLQNAINQCLTKILSLPPPYGLRHSVKTLSALQLYFTPRILPYRY